MDFRKLPDEALLRIPELVRPHGPLPFARSRWLEEVAAGRAPQPVRLGKRCTCWKWGDIRKYLDELAKGADDGHAR